MAEVRKGHDDLQSKFETFQLAACIVPLSWCLTSDCSFSCVTQDRDRSRHQMSKLALLLLQPRREQITTMSQDEAEGGISMWVFSSSQTSYPGVETDTLCRRHSSRQKNAWMRKQLAWASAAARCSERFLQRPKQLRRPAQRLKFDETK